jgi:hypothetical protein
LTACYSAWRAGGGGAALVTLAEYSHQLDKQYQVVFRAGVVVRVERNSHLEE